MTTWSITVLTVRVIQNIWRCLEVGGERTVKTQDIQKQD